VFLQGTVLAESSEETEITVTMYSCYVTAARLEVENVVNENLKYSVGNNQREWFCSSLFIFFVCVCIDILVLL